MGEAGGALAGDEWAVDAEAHLVGFGHKDEFVPVGIRLPRDDDLLRLEQGVEIGGQGNRKRTIAPPSVKPASW